MLHSFRLNNMYFSSYILIKFTYSTEIEKHNKTIVWTGVNICSQCVFWMLFAIMIDTESHERHIQWAGPTGDKTVVWDRSANLSMGSAWALPSFASVYYNCKYKGDEYSRICMNFAVTHTAPKQSILS